MKIEVLGMGCMKCKRLERLVLQAVEELGVVAEVVKVEDLNEITERGIMMTPALYINGEARVVGRVPSLDEIKSMIKSAL
ncbi:MAG: thioredoxin family protein [Methanomassiliicoccales archaeon]